MDVGDRVLGFAGRAGLGDGVAFRDVCTSANAQCPEMRERHLVLGERDRHRRAVHGH
jgi:hypothetical protein